VRVGTGTGALARAAVSRATFMAVLVSVRAGANWAVTFSSRARSASLPASDSRRNFLDAHGEEFFVDTGRARRSCVAALRRAEVAASADPRAAEIITALLASSPAFAVLWKLHDAYGKAVESKRMRHPTVGEFTLTAQTFDARGASGQELVVYSADPGSVDGASSLRLLSSAAGRGACGTSGNHPWWDTHAR